MDDTAVIQKVLNDAGDLETGDDDEPVTAEGIRDRIKLIGDLITAVSPPGPRLSSSMNKRVTISPARLY